MAILLLFDWCNVIRCFKSTWAHLGMLWIQINAVFPHAMGVYTYIAVKMVEKHKNADWAWSTLETKPRIAHSTHLYPREATHLVRTPSVLLECHSWALPSHYASSCQICVRCVLFVSDLYLYWMCRKWMCWYVCMQFYAELRIARWFTTQQKFWIADVSILTFRRTWSHSKYLDSGPARI